MSLAKIDGTVVSANIEYADTLIKQIVGLMFRTSFEGALVFDLGRERFEGIHMLFVRFPIDVIFLDSNKKIIDVKTSLKPWIGSALPHSRFRYAIKMPAGAVERMALKTGEQLVW